MDKRDFIPTQHQPHAITYRIHENICTENHKIHTTYVHQRSIQTPLLPSNLFISAASQAVTPPTENATSNLHDFIGSELSGLAAHSIPSSVIVPSLK